jgi:hypothetical protein
MRASIQKALSDVSDAQRRLNAAVRRAQKTCKHLDLAECDYQSLNFGGALEPMRVCRSCGMSEIGWGCGYIVLEGKAVEISRDDLYGLRRGLMLGHVHKGPLLRGEITLSELVDQHFEETR